MKSLVINIDSKCNAACLHCCFSCSPDSTDCISGNEIDNILDIVKDREDIRQVAITGGEPLLRHDEVIKIIKESSNAGKDVTLITNGFWAKNIDITNEVLTELINCGLRAITVSYDYFHAQFIPISAVKNLFSALKHYDVSTALNMVVDREHKGKEIIDKLGETVFGVPITMVPVSRVGRGSYISDKKLYFTDYRNSKLECPATSWEFVIHHNGFVYPCCSPMVFETSLILGDIRTESIEDIEENLFSNIILLILKENGLNWFIEKMGLKLDLSKFVSVCEVCKIVFESADNIDKIYEDVLEYYENMRKEL